MPKRNPAWEAVEDESLRQYYETEGLDWSEIAERMGRSRSACKTRYYAAIRDEPEPDVEEDEPQGAVLLPLEISKETINWRDRIDVAKAVKQLRDADQLTTYRSKRTIKTDRPFGILHTSDWQMGSLGVDMETWHWHMDRFMNIPNLAMIINGDMISNCYAHKTLVPVLSQVMTPREQMRFVESILLEMVEKEKILAITLSEEHDQRDERVTGISALKEILRPIACPFFDNRGDLVLEIGERLYIYHIVHKSRYNSSMNRFHTAQRESSLFLPANVIFTAHTHRPGIAKQNAMQELADMCEFLDAPFRFGGDQFLVQSGTYEVHSRFGDQLFGQLPPPELQILIFDPHRHDIKIATSFEEAEKLLN